MPGKTAHFNIKWHFVLRILAGEIQEEAEVQKGIQKKNRSNCTHPFRQFRQQMRHVVTARFWHRPVCENDERNPERKDADVKQEHEFAPSWLQMEPAHHVTNEA